VALDVGRQRGIMAALNSPTLRGTRYSNFASKDDLFFAVFGRARVLVRESTRAWNRKLTRHCQASAG